VRARKSLGKHEQPRAILNSLRCCLLLSLAVLVLSGCGETEPPPEPPPATTRERVVIGIIPEQNIFRQIERYEILTHHLSEVTGIDVETKMLPRYGNLIDNFTFAGLDGAFFGSFTYALAHERLGVSVLARPINLDGRSTYHGMILVRADSGIEGVEQMRGRRFVFVDKATTAGYLLPLDYFITHGVRDYESYFGETYFAGTHEDAIYDVVNRKADMGAAKNTVFDRLVAVDQELRTELKILARSPEVPENALALKRDVDPAVTQRLLAGLLEMHTDPRGHEVLQSFGALRFIETSDEDYRPVLEYAAQVGLDLSTYDYLND